MRTSPLPRRPDRPAGHGRVRQGAGVRRSPPSPPSAGNRALRSRCARRFRSGWLRYAGWLGRRRRRGARLSAAGRATDRRGHDRPGHHRRADRRARGQRRRARRHRGDRQRVPFRARAVDGLAAGSVDPARAHGSAETAPARSASGSPRTTEPRRAGGRRFVDPRARTARSDPWPRSPSGTISDRAAVGLPASLAGRRDDRGRGRRGRRLPDALDQAVVPPTSGMDRKRWWWRIIGRAAMAADRDRDRRRVVAAGPARPDRARTSPTSPGLPSTDVGGIGQVPSRRLLLIGGAVAGILISLLVKPLVALGASGAGSARMPACARR